ncbi:MAG: sensor domain-containing diguanylate cyclase [Chloroflexi bacterium]|nr:sensor domain-containing diguanylate cyclase [Chloroflexota bacterium]
MEVLEDNFHKNLIDNLYDGVYFVDCERRITYWNKGAERITGYGAEKVVGTFCNNNLLNHITDDGVQLCMNGCPLQATLEDGQPREAEVHLRHAEGYRVPVLVRTTPMRGKHGGILGAVEVFSNSQSLFKIRRRVDELEKKSFLDPLTGIGNRAYTEMKVNSAIAEFHQHEMPFGLLFIDIDHFKAVNDTCGHNTGDRVLQNVAKTLSLHLRATDLCGRWGGEEFVVVLLNVNANNLPLVAEKLRAMIANSRIQIEGTELQVTVSMGATLVCPGDNLKSLIQRADELMYQSKLNGRNQVTAGYCR